jgi:hypothetical protein
VNLDRGKALRRSAILTCFACVASVGVLQAQTTQTEVKSGTVAYVSGNDVIVKMDTGEVRHFAVSEGRTFNVDGKQLTVHDLKPGTHLTGTITTTSTPKNVRAVRTVTGKVWQVNAPYVIVTLADGKNKQYKVPDGTKFKVNGEDKTVFDLRKGMNVSATVVTDTPETVVSRDTSVSGTGPVAKAVPKPVTPPQTGALLIEEPAPAPTQMAKAEPPPAPAQAAPEPKPSRLPKTASSLPLVGLAGLLALAAGVGMRIRRVGLG